MKRFNCDFSSRFRILKGGKISLVVSALLGSVIIANASPTAGVVTSGTATISQTGNTTNINQTTSKASINWQNFNIASNETVNFNQPNVNSITLNRVIGNEKSVINGALNANGQVWILNSNGILFSKDAKVNTSGLVATTAELSDKDFQDGNYNFKNSKSNSVVNLGTIDVSNSGYVVLASNEVRNSGTIKAIKGKVYLSGNSEYTINLNGNSIVNLIVTKGVLDAMVENSGTIVANGGEIYLTTNAVNELLKGVVNNTGIIEANSLDDVTGKVEVFAHGGTANVGGEIKAEGGFVETSGKKIDLKDNVKVKSKTWLIDPYDIEIVNDSVIETTITPSSGTYTAPSDSTKIKASTLVTALNTGTNVTVTTTGAGTQNGDITVNSAISWTSNSGLTLKADRNIYINSDITATGATAKLSLYYGQSAVSSGNTADYYIEKNSKINLSDGQNFSTKLGNNGNLFNYTVISSVTQLQNMSLGSTSVYYALGTNIDATETITSNSGAGFSPLGTSSSNSFKGYFDGLGHTIDKFTINRPTTDYVGLFGFYNNSAGKIVNINFTNANITGKNYVGIVAGQANIATISRVNTSGSIIAASTVGGMAGYVNGTSGITMYSNSSSVNISVAGNYAGGIFGSLNQGIISDSFATGDISLTGSSGYYGGLIGNLTNATVTNSYATGNISIASGNSATNVGSYTGGLVGNMTDGAQILNSYATGNITTQSYDVGGLVGQMGSSTTSTSNTKIDKSYSLGSVTNTWVNSRYSTGGLVGLISFNLGTLDVVISNSYSTGRVNTGQSTGVTGGGFIGESSSYGSAPSAGVGLQLINNNWSSALSNQTSAIGNSSYSALIETNNSNNFASSSSYLSASYANFDFTNDWYMIAGRTRPMLRSEYSTNIQNIHQLQLIGMNTTTLDASYFMTKDIDFKKDASTYNSATKSFLGSYFTPIGTSATPFTGTFDGNGHTISNIDINNSDSDLGTTDSNTRHTGLFGYTGLNSLIENIGLLGGTVQTDNTKSLGSLVGYAKGSIENSYSTANVYGNNNDGYSSNVNYPVGGLVGELNSGTASDYATITSSYYSGEVQAPGVRTVGGFVGQVGYGKISNTYALGSVSGFTTVGGFVGYLADGPTNSTIVIEKSYVANIVTAGSTTGNNSYRFTGGMNAYGTPGRTDSTTTFFNTDSSLGTNLVSSQYIGIGGATGISKSQMQTKSTFTSKGWDFTNIWGIKSEFNTGYPVLRTFYKPTDLVDTIGLNYNLSNITSGYIYTGSEISLSPLWNASSIFGSTDYSSWQAGTDYKFIYNTGDVTGFTDAGTYSGITIGILKSGYVVSSTGNTTGSFTITPKALTITASNQTETYGNTATLGNSAYTSSGLVSGQNIGNITLSSSGSAATAYAGTYSIVASNAANNGAFKLSNYDITYADGTLTKSKRDITLRANDITSKIYDGVANSGGNGFALSSGSFVNSDTLGTSFDTTAMTYTGTSEGAKNVGSYTVSVSGVTSTNYNPTFINGSFAITPKDLSVTGTTVNSRVYDGGTLTTLNNLGTLNGFIGTEGDNISVKLTLDGFGTDIRFNNANVGTGKDVTINWRLQGTGYQNYSLAQTILTGAADITPRAITLTASSATKIYGNSEATLNVTANSQTQNTGLASTDSLSQVTGTLTREAGENAGIYDIALGTGAKAGNYDITFVTDNNAYTITKKDINILGLSGANKTYDGTTTATLSGTASLDSSSLVSGDASDVTVDLSGLVGNFVNANAGNTKAINVSGITITGTKAGNYNVGAVTGLTADILKKDITAITGITALNKTYDRNTTAVLTTTNASFTGIVGSEVLTVASSTGAFSDKNVGDNKTVNITGLTLGGTTAGNYNLTTTTASTTANITKADLSVSGATASNKVYDALTSATVNSGSISAISGDTVTLSDANATFADKNVADGKAVTTHYTISGTDAGNYNLIQQSGITANITKADLSVSGATASNKVYDALTSATVNSGSISAISGDTVTLSDANATFADKNVADGKAVTTHYTISGTDAGNYNLIQQSGITANITKADLSVSGAIASNKVYDALTSATVNSGSISAISGDTVTLSDANATFADKNVADGKAVTTHYTISGTDAGNYNLIQQSGITANITKKALTIATTTTNDKVYDGNTTADVNLGTLSGFVGSETVTTSAVGTFASKDVGTRTATFVYTLADGTNGGLANNYSLANTTDDAEITKKALTIATTTTNDKVYDGNTNADVNLGTLSGFVGSETVTTSAVGTFASKNVGNRTATFVYTLANGTNGGLANNYSLVNTTDDAQITRKTLSVSGLTIGSKTYDGTNSATLSNAGTIDNVNGDDVSFSTIATFNNKNVEANKTVNLDYTLSGADATNYSLVDVSGITTNALINAKVLTVSGLTVTSKIFDGTNSATVSNAGSVNKVDGDDLNFNTVATFNNADVESVKTVNLNYTLSGTEASNYILTNLTGVPTNVLISVKPTIAQVTVPKTTEVTGVPVKLDGILSNELISQGTKIVILDASNNDVTELAKQGKIQPGKYSVKAINDNTNYALSSNTVELTINPALDPITVVKTQVSAPVIPVTTAPVVTVNTPATQNTQISNNLSVKLGIADSGNVNLVSQTTVGQSNQVVTLSELKTSSQDNANDKKEIKLDDVRVSLNQNSIVQLVNGGVNLPTGVDQQFYVVRQDINTNSSNGTTNQNSETKDNKKNKGTN